MKKRNYLNSPRLLELKRERRKFFLKKILLALLALALFLALSAYISRLKILNISTIEIINSESKAEEMRETVQNAISGNYAWFFPKSNILFYPKSKIKKELLDKFKGIEKLAIEVKIGNVLGIALSTRDASYIWCGTHAVFEVKDKSVCYFMDEKGYIFEEAAEFSPNVYFTFYGDLTASINGALEENSDAPPGSSFSPEAFDKLVKFKESLHDLGFSPIALYSDKDGDAKIFLDGAASPGTLRSLGPEIIFNTDSDFQKISENLESALSTEPLHSDFKNKFSSLKYIDLRFGNKVYYKFQ